MSDQAEQICANLRDQYEAVRTLPDGTVAALGKLMFTTAIYLDCEMWGYGRRFCFADATLARLRFEELQSCDDEPAGYIARRHAAGEVVR